MANPFFVTIIDYYFCIYGSKIVIAQAHISFPLFLYKNKYVETLCTF